MSYAKNQHSRRGRPRKRPLAYQVEWSSAMGGWLEDLAVAAGVQPHDPCAAARDAKTAVLDQQTNDLARTWAADNGLYTVADMTRMRDQVMALLLSSSRALDQALAPASTGVKSAIRQAQGMIYAKESESLQFTNAINAANAQGVKVIESKGFKAWVINSMNKSSVGLGFVAYAACLKPAIVSFLQQTQIIWDTAIKVGRALVRTAVKTAEVVLAIPDTALDVIKYAKYGAAAYAAYWLYTKTRSL